MSKGRLATAKRIGRNVEQVVIDRIDPLRSASNPEEWFDAVASTVIGPRQPHDLIFGSCCLVPRDSLIEIKSCKRQVSNGPGDRPGRWMLQINQHEKLLSSAAFYLLVVYEDTSAGKDLGHLLIVPATIVDEVVSGSWYTVDRHEGGVCQLPWPHLLEDGGLR